MKHFFSWCIYFCTTIFSDSSIEYRYFLLALLSKMVVQVIFANATEDLLTILPVVLKKRDWYKYTHTKCIHRWTRTANLLIVGLVTHYCTVMRLMAAPLTLAYIWSELGVPSQWSIVLTYIIDKIYSCRSQSQTWKLKLELNSGKLRLTTCMWCFIMFIFVIFQRQNNLSHTKGVVIPTEL